MGDRIVGWVFDLVLRLPTAVAVWLIVAVNLILGAVALAEVGPQNLATKILVEIAWALAVFYTSVVAMMLVMKLIKEEPRFQLLNLQYQASDFRWMSWKDFERLIVELLRKQDLQVKV